MKILITHVYSQNNKGDLAILIAMIQQLKKTFPNSKLNVLTTDSLQNSYKYEDILFSSSFFFYCIYKNKNTFVRIYKTPQILISSFLWAFFYKYFGITADQLIPKEIVKTCHLYLESDLILPVGGGYLKGSNSLQSNVSLIIQLHAILIAKILNKKIILYSQSVGPFESYFQHFISKFTLNKIDGIFARESYTLKTLNQMNIDPNRIFKTIDAAFLFKTTKKASMKFELQKKGIKNKNYLVGITVRNWLSRKGQKFYEEQIAYFVRFLTENENVNVVFIPQVTSDFHNDDDRKVQRRILKVLGKTDGVFYLDVNYDPYQLKGIYENLDFLIGTRMHSVIFALTGLVPCIAIEYEYKTSGIMKDLNLSEYVIKIDEVSTEELIKLFNKLKKNKLEYKRTLQISLNEYLKREQNISRILKSIYSQNNNFKSNRLSTNTNYL